MRKKTLALLLAGIMTLSLAACGEAGDKPAPESPPPSQSEEPSAPPSPTAETPQPSETQPPASPLPEEPSPSPEEPTAEELSLPERDYQPWQAGYIGFLTRLRRSEFANESAYAAMSEAERESEAGRSLWNAIIGEGSESYSLYDVDKDDVPELFVKFGDYEAAYHTRCYTFRDGETVLLGEFPSGHSSLYTYPDKNAFLVHRAHMGCAELYEYSIADGQLTGGETLLTEGNVTEYTDPGEVVPGAEAVHSNRTRMIRVDSFDFDGTGQLPPSLDTPLLLPVCEWYDGPPATGSDSERARGAILAVLEDNAPFTGVSGDGFYGDTGRTTWEEYVQPGAAYPYGEYPYQVTRYVWLDMNRDGQEECVVRLTGQGENAALLGDEATVVLSEQDGEVYAYYFRFYNHSYIPYMDGTIRSDTGTIAWAMSFWKDQCCESFVSPDETVQPAEWIEVG